MYRNEGIDFELHFLIGTAVAVLIAFFVLGTFTYCADKDVSNLDPDSMLTYSHDGNYIEYINEQNNVERIGLSGTSWKVREQHERTEFEMDRENFIIYVPCKSVEGDK